MKRVYGLKKILLILIALVLFGCASSDFIKEGDKFVSTGAWEEAVTKYSKALAKDPSNVEYRLKYRRAKSMASQVHFDKGVNFQKEGNLDQAILEFKASILLDPSNKKAEMQMRRAQKKQSSLLHYAKGLEYVEEGDIREAKKSFKKSISLNKSNKAAKAELEKLKDKKRIKIGGYELDLKSTAPITLKFKDEKIKKVFRYLSELSGINFIFDSDVRDKKASLFLKEGTFHQALDLLLMTNKLSKKVVSENTIVVYPKTPQKAKQYEDMLIKVFYLSNIEAKKAVNLLRTMIKARDIYVHSELNALVVRAKPEAIELAKKILAVTDLPDAEVMLAVDVMEVDRNQALKLGLDLSPYSIGISAPSSAGITSITGADLKILSSNKMLVNLPSGVLNFGSENLDAELLANPRIRVKNNEKAKIHIGERVPIISAIITGGATATTSDKIEYLDVGIILSVEPRVTPDDEIDLVVDLDVSSLGTKTETPNGTIAYQIGTRTVKTTLRLYDGETQIIGGLISDEERSSVVKIPGLGDIPIIGRLFSNTDKSKVKTDILLSITPHIVRSLDIPDDELTEIWSGREDSPSGGSSARNDTGRGYSQSGIVGKDFFDEEGNKTRLPTPPPPGMVPGGSRTEPFGR
ncbi:MAG: tetratricopeptide repeat protein [Deltaproteobacteria bacterium]|nr:tetratricopeptide repeat protein [Deltaproteobacteria bacterium]